MKYETFFEVIINALDSQMKEYEETGVMPQLVLPQLEGHELKVESTDPPDVRRRVILYRAKLREWKAFGARQDLAREDAKNFCLANIEAIMETLL